MAGNIQNLDREKFRSVVNHYLTQATMLRAHLLNTVTYLNSMRTNWTGKRMNEILIKWNALNDTAYQTLKYFYVDVYTILWDINMRYISMEDSGTVMQMNNHPVYIDDFSELKVDIQLTNENFIKFNRLSVESFQRLISSRLSEMNIYMEEMLTDILSVSQYSDSIASLAEKFKNMYSVLKTELDDLNNIMNKTISEAIEIVKATENYNEADVSKLS